jgi:hypothetical protein
MPAEPKVLGPFRFSVDAVRAAAFAREIGADESRVPLSYPAVWIADEKIFDPVRDLCAADDVVPVHESQSFAFDAPLQAGADYDVRVTLRREETPPRLILDAQIDDATGAPVAKSETMLRLVPRAGFGAAA